MRDTMLTSHDGIGLALRDHGGHGPDVLLLHGATRNLEQRFHGSSGATAPPTTS